MEEEKYKWKVCVRCFTYNHAPYITEAMNGFTMQQTDFPFVCCIVDDASTDGEQEVIKKYIADNFEISEETGTYEKGMDYGTLIFARHKTNNKCFFAVLLLKSNHYSSQELKDKKRSYISEWENSCEYEALCEGDDYWIDPLKLQKQVDFLDNNPEYGLVYTDIIGFDVLRNQEIDMKIKNLNGELLESILREDHNIWTLTVCFRKEYLTLIPKLDPSRYFVGDRLLFMTIASNSLAHCIFEKTAVYRILQNSASHYSKDKANGTKFLTKCYRTNDYFLENNATVTKNTWKIVKRNLATALISQAYYCNQRNILEDVYYPISTVSTFRDLILLILFILGRKSDTMFKIIIKIISIFGKRPSTD